MVVGHSGGLELAARGTRGGSLVDWVGVPWGEVLGKWGHIHPHNRHRSTSRTVPSSSRAPTSELPCPPPPRREPPTPPRLPLHGRGSPPPRPPQLPAPPHHALWPPPPPLWPPHGCAPSPQLRAPSPLLPPLPAARALIARLAPLPASASELTGRQPPWRLQEPASWPPSAAQRIRHFGLSAILLSFTHELVTLAMHSNQVSYAGLHSLVQ